MKYNKIRICYKISLLISIKAFHINKLLWPLKISENLRFSNYFRWKIGYVIVSTLFDIRSKIWQNTYCNPKVNMHSQYGSQSQYAQSIWLTKSIWTVAFKATLSLLWFSRSFLLVEGIWCWETSLEESVLPAGKITCEVTLLPCSSW